MESGREELTRRRGAAEGLEDAFAQKDKKEAKGRLESGRKGNIENHGSRFADMERGREADAQSGRGRPARAADGGLENGDYRRESRRETQSCMAWKTRATCMVRSRASIR